MKKIRLGLYSTDAEYLLRASAYIRASSYRERFRLALFTELGHCLTYLEGQEGLDVLLAELEPGQSLIQDRTADADCTLIVLSEDSVMCDLGSKVFPKYQPVNKLLDAVLLVLNQGQDQTEASASDRSPIMAVYSASGGSGKTVFAYTAAGLLAKMGLRPIAISLEGLPSSCWSSEADEEDGYGRALYHAGKGPAYMSKVEECFKWNAERRFHYLPASRHPDELLQMGEQETAALIHAAAASPKGNVLILDLDSGRDPRTMAALQACDTLVFLVPNHMWGRGKASGMLMELTGSNRQGSGVLRYGCQLTVMLSMCADAPSGTVRDAAWGNPAAAVDAEEALPLEPEWLNLKNLDPLSGRSLYQERVFRWLSEWVNNSLPGLKGGMRHDG
ncbi:hypothetical protein [Gorillibacterium sp. sgz5001074]|uniref:hypothetical protein n=1 Tax=Gorillibacterium sp. sgz5001074 TaxID=3446695 RepID=UPI003F66EAA5